MIILKKAKEVFILMWTGLRKNYETVYHYTHIDNVSKIKEDRKILKGKDTHCFFAESIEDIMIIIGHTVAKGEEGRFKNLQGRIERYPEFIPEDFVILELETQYTSWDDWSYWMDYDKKTAISEHYFSEKDYEEYTDYSKKKIGYKGNLRFKKCEEHNLMDYIDDYFDIDENGKYLLKEQYRYESNRF